MRKRVGRQSRNRATASGYTLMEVLLAATLSTALLAGIGGSLAIALQAADPDVGVASSVLNAQTQLTHAAAELQFATAVVETTSRTITVQVPDRDGDRIPETVAYLWKGPGQPLLRQYNGAPADTVLADVALFDVTVRGKAPSRFLMLRLSLPADAASEVVAGVTLLNTPS